jgi:Rod binding domain-containing protein
VPKGELLSGSSDERTYRDMMNEALATSIASGRGIGVKDVILHEMRQQEARANSSSPTVVGDDDDGNGGGD